MEKQQNNDESIYEEMLEDKQDGRKIPQQDIEAEKKRVLKFRDEWEEVVKRRK